MRCASPNYRFSPDSRFKYMYSLARWVQRHSEEVKKWEPVLVEFDHAELDQSLGVLHDTSL